MDIIDTTLGILRGIIPVSHIFQHYFNTSIKTKFNCNVKVNELNEGIEYIRE